MSDEERVWKDIVSPEEKRKMIDKLQGLQDSVNHPSHYTAHPSGVECIDVTEHMNFNVGNAVKYLWRAGLKTEEGLDAKAKHLQDLKKARWYIDREIQRVSKE